MQKQILNKGQIDTKLYRLALEIAESIPDETETLVVIGIKEAGNIIANAISNNLSKIISNPIVNVEASLIKQTSSNITFNNPLDIMAKHVLIIDDVSNSGKTLTYILSPILQFHPLSIKTAVLVERMYKTFAVKPDFVGLSLATLPNDFIEVICHNNEIEGAYLRSKS